MTIRPGEPLSVQVANALRAEILAGTYGPGDALPSERELRDRFGVSGGTVRGALARLSGDRWPMWLLISSRDLGQNVTGCGKSLDHMQLSAPHQDNVFAPAALLKNVV